MTAPLLAVDRLAVHYPGRKRLVGQSSPTVRAVNDVSFEIEEGRTFGLVGESGCGKSSVARAILQLAAVHAGTIRLEGDDVTDIVRRDELSFRRRVQAVLQDPYSSLNQAHRARTIVGDGITRHFGTTGADRDRRVEQLIADVGLTADLLERYPSEMSGGQRQRVSIARALAVSPKLIVADEATSALDVSIQGQVVNLLQDVQRDEGVALLFIGHDLDVVSHLSHDIGVMYLGYLVERGNTASVSERPAHPYTDMLLSSIPVPNPAEQRVRRQLRRAYAPAEPPSPTNVPVGCAFANRCPVAMDVCTEEMPGITPAHGGGVVRCHLHTTGPRLDGGTVVDYIRSESPTPTETSA